MTQRNLNIFEGIWRSLTTHVANSFYCSFENALVQIEPQLNGIEDFINLNQTEDLLYFTHSDHLGSSSFITDLSGEAVQHLQYLPFGESFVSQTSTSWQTRYSFSGKEKDEETGYSYFGARYYDSDLSIWLSVDPLADKYPSMSVYMYTAGNPINLLDPDGNYLFGLFGSTKEQREAAKSFQSKHGGEIVNIHKKSICVSYQQAIGYTKFGSLINEPVMMIREQYFTKNGSLIPQEGTVRSYEPNTREKWRNNINSDEQNVAIKTIGNIAFSTADGVSVFLTSFAVVQDITGLDRAVKIDGSPVENNKELLEKGIDGLTTLGTFALSGTKSLLKGADSYSVYANNKNWTKNLSKDSKEFLRNAVNNSANQNIKSNKFMNRSTSATSVINEIIE
jgi:RHS repeat-associated protein